MTRTPAARRDEGRRARPWCVLGAVLSALIAPPLRAEDVRVPGGPAAVRRLVGLEPASRDESFFLDLHTALLAEADPHASWERIPRRKLVRDFTLDVAEWRREFGESAALSTADAESQKRLRRALIWLGYEVRFTGHAFTARPKDDVVSARRQTFLDALGLSTPAVLRHLQAGETITVRAVDGTAPLPFGLAAWRETLNDPQLGADTAFTALLQNVPASRLLVALHALDAPTRERLRAAGDWRVLLERCLDGFARFPEAITLEGDAFSLPGGPEAATVWTSVFKLPARGEHAAFLEALYARDDARTAYLVDVLQQLPPETAKAILVRGSGGDVLARARTLARAIEQSGSHAREKREPYDFAHLARFLRFDDAGHLSLPGGARALQAALSGTGLPADEAQLQALLAAANASATADEVLAEIVRRSDTGRFTPQRRLVIVQGVCDANPALDDPATALLLFRGADRLQSVYTVLAELPIDDPALARRVLFACDRLDRGAASREGELAAGSFQTALALLAALHRSGTLPDGETRLLLEALLEREGPGWTTGQLLPALRNRERAALEQRWSHEAAYRTALEERNARIEARHGGERERLERARLEAEQRVKGLLEPVCPPDDSLPGPWPPRFVVEREWLARGAPSTPELPADALAQAWINEAIALESQRARPLASGGGPMRVPGALPGTSALVDPSEPLPELAPSPDIVESRGDDELLTRALVGSPKPALFDWRGARYRFDPAADTRARRTRFRERQRLPALELVEEGVARLASLRGGSASPQEAERLRDALVPAGEEPPPPGAADLRELERLLAERHLEALLGHLYATHAVDPEDLFFADSGLVRRHAFAPSPFAETALTRGGPGGGSRVTGSVFGLPEVLSLLHAEQLSYRADAIVPTDEVKTALVVTANRVEPLALDDASLAAVAASCRAAEAYLESLTGRDPLERLALLRAEATDLVTRHRLGAIAEAPDTASAELSPSDLYRLGRRLARSDVPRQRLRPYGPRAAGWTGLQRLDDLDLPPYERLAAYRSPQLFCDRLYDLKVMVARRLAEAALPAVLLPLVLPAAVDDQLVQLKMAYAYDWQSVVRAAEGFSPADLDRLLDAARESGRLVREEALDVVRELP